MGAKPKIYISKIFSKKYIPKHKLKMLCETYF